MIVEKLLEARQEDVNTHKGKMDLRSNIILLMFNCYNKGGGFPFPLFFQPSQLQYSRMEWNRIE